MTELQYQLPCVYCTNGTSFGSSDDLKKHLIGSHSSIISGGSKSRLVCKEEHGDLGKKDLKKDKGLSRIPTSEVYKSFHDASGIRSPMRRSSPRGSFISSQVSQPVRSEMEVVDFSQKKIKRLNDLLHNKNTELNQLHAEIELLKGELTSKDEDQHRVKQRWRKEAEDAIRNLKTSYEDVLAHNRMLEKQLSESESEKIKLRQSNDDIAKDHLDFQTIVAAEKLNFQKEQQQYSKSASRTTDQSKELTKMLSSDLQTFRKENESMAVALTTKDDQLKKLKEELSTTESKLNTERQSNKSVNKENVALKGQLALLEANCIQVETSLTSQNGSFTSLNSKYKKMKSTYEEYVVSMKSIQNTNEKLTNEIAALKDDKAKLVNNLQVADKALCTLGSRVSLPNESRISCSPLKKMDSNLSLANAISHDVKATLDQIVESVKQFPIKEHASYKDECTRLNIELQKSNLQLMEEKAVVKELQNTLDDMEVCVRDTESLTEVSEKKSEELKKLQNKHRDCAKTANLKRQLSREKKNLQRKIMEIEKQNEILNFMHDSLKSEHRVKETFIQSLTLDYEKSQQDKASLTQAMNDLKEKVNGKDILLEKFKRESCFLLEKFNKASEENEQSRQRYEKLENRLDGFTNISDLKNNLDDMQQSIVELRDGFDKTKLHEYSSFSTVVQQNEYLSLKVIELQKQLCDGETKYDELNQKIKVLHQENDSKDQMIKQLKEKNEEPGIFHDPLKEQQLKKKIENLSLEKDILSSRVMVLEAIREEVEILRKEKVALKNENLSLKGKLKYEKTVMRSSELSELDKTKTQNLSNQENFNQEASCILFTSASDAINDRDSTADDFLENMKTLDDLCEEDKVKLNDLLSTPFFESFLSNNDVKINLLESDASSTNNGSFQSLNEHVINHIYEGESDTMLFENCSNEYITQIHHSDEEVNEPNSNETTVDYGSVSKASSSAKQTKPLSSSNVPQNISRSLEKIFSDSKMIREGIAKQSSHASKPDYSHVLHEFQKVITEMSGTDSNTSLVSESRSMSTPSKVKQVTFSDHIVEVFDTPKNNQVSNQNKSSDAVFYRSFFQEALKNNYPNLASYDDVVQDFGGLSQDEDSSLNSSTSQSNSPDNMVKNATHLSRVHPLALPTVNNVTTTTTRSVTSSINKPILENNQLPTTQIKSQNPTVFSKNSNIKIADKLLDNIAEPKESPEKQNYNVDSSKNNQADVSDALNILKTFIKTADKSKQSSLPQSSNSSDTSIQSVVETDPGSTFDTKGEIENEMEIPRMNNLLQSSKKYEYSPNIRAEQNYGNDEIMITLTEALNSTDYLINNENSFEKTSGGEAEYIENIAEYHRDNMSFEDFGGSLFHNSARNSANNLIVPGLPYTPSVPSTMHRPVSLDFSDASFQDFNLFSKT